MLHRAVMLAAVVLCLPAAPVFRGGLGLAASSRPGIGDAGKDAISIVYPEDGSIFPPEMTAPTFLWRDAEGGARTWRIEIRFGDGARAIEADSAGAPMPVGETDPRCISSNNELPVLSAEQASTHSWKPEPAMWAAIKQHSVQRAAVAEIVGLDAGGRVLSRGHIRLLTSRDPVGAPIFYRDVPLMPSEGKAKAIQPLSPSLLYLINWRIRDIAQPESRIVMHDLHTCANCHSFSADGRIMGMDVDGPDNDKGMYAIVPVGETMSIRKENMIAWNSDLRVGQSRTGFMSQVSPDGRYVLSTFAGQGQTVPDSYFVTNFKDYRFLQVFYPTRGILAYYNRATGRRQPLRGADDPRYVQTDGVWSPDGKYVVFARAEAKDPNPPGKARPVEANDANEVAIQYSLYRVPFNEGKGGKAEPIAGASNNGMSNNFPKVSPDGRWIVFVKNRNGQLMRPDSELYIVPVKGGAARRMRCNMSLMNSWHSFSPNGRWLVFSSKGRSPYTGMFLTHIDADGTDSPAIYVENATAANRAVNIPEFVNMAPDGLKSLNAPVTDLYRVMDEALELGRRGELAAAEAKWRQALALDAGDARANNGMGIALGVAGHSDEAIGYFRKATEIDGNFFEAYYNLAGLLTREKRMDEAVEAWRNTVRIWPGFSRGHEKLGYALYGQGRFKEALAEVRLALQGEPDRAAALELAATLLATCPDRSLRNGGEALEFAERAQRLSGVEDAAALDIVSAAYAESGRFAEAMAVEHQAVERAERHGDTVLRSTLEAHLQRYGAHAALTEPPDAGLF